RLGERRPLTERHPHVSGLNSQLETRTFRAETARFRWYFRGKRRIIEPSDFARGRPFGRPSQGDDMAKKATSKRKPNAAFMKPVTPDAALSEVVGSKPLPRTELTKKLWAYIKKNGLQDKKNKRMIKSDDALKTVFGGKAQVNMFEMTKLVNKHVK